LEESKTHKPTSFNLALEELKLPKPEKQADKNKSGNKKKVISFLPHHMITKISLDNFGEVSRSSIKELLESIDLMPCLKALSLRNNRITDDYDKEILAIFDNKSITNVDLSNNLMKKLGMDIGKKLKDDCTHITWIDLTQNDFIYDGASVNMIINGLKK
jgi:Leucine-rich repeat (LRR) protein